LHWRNKSLECPPDAPKQYLFGYNSHKQRNQLGQYRWPTVILNSEFIIILYNIEL
jgi:hypothetical protein